ncbi:DNA-processing protein DprA [Thioalkalivibrio sp.]|uniref:DNA-processing protein DprA n=1 Tax=Thioalkalivibrio sp. TaxID=2093813 RepID=UPI0012D5EB70|nr:DNA-processing protein DprA [Thioalkalivibrio sp.]TVP78255.1 MAG: DNA-processing protein DprA [Thioalkalivibrio sp.]
MNISTQAQAVLLLNAWFSKPEKGEPKPLTPAEWGRLALWLRDNKRSPEGLLAEQDALADLDRWQDRSITAERVAWLLGRSGGLGLALERWERAGLWVMIRSDADYPPRLKKRLGVQAPPLFFGCGSRGLLAGSGLAVVGSRDANPDDLAFTEHLGAIAAQQGFSVVSGGARGVDEAAMLGALERSGTAVGVVADQLLRAATSSKYRKALMAGNLVLISPFNPEARFEVGNAMARNKYIYCLSDAAVVVASSQGKGGTWSGAIENLKRGWVPLWVRKPADARAGSGNAALVKQGGRWLPPEVTALGELLDVDRPKPVGGEQGGLFDNPPNRVKSTEIHEPSNIVLASDMSEAESAITPESATSAVHSIDKVPDLYAVFLLNLAGITRDEPMGPDELMQHLEICKTQLNEWLKRALAEGAVKKLKNPVRYRVVATKAETR